MPGADVSGVTLSFPGRFNEDIHACVDAIFEWLLSAGDAGGV